TGDRTIRKINSGSPARLVSCLCFWTERTAAALHPRNHVDTKETFISARGIGRRWPEPRRRRDRDRGGAASGVERHIDDALFPGHELQRLDPPARVKRDVLLRGRVAERQPG